MKISDYSFAIDYSLSSEIGDIGIARYQQEIIGKIYHTMDDDEKIEVGKFNCTKLLVGQSESNGYSRVDLFDYSDVGMEILSNFFDIENDGDFLPEYADLFMDLLPESILVLERMEILPEFKGLGLGKIIGKSIIQDFYSLDCLVVFKAFPLQLEGTNVLEVTENFRKKMGYENFLQDEKKAKISLNNYHKSRGFLNLPKGRKDIFYYNPTLKNKRFDSIDLNKSF